MLKKTTIYLDEKEIETLKKVSFLLKTSMTDLIRRGIQRLYESLSKEDSNALKVLGEIRDATKKSGFPEGKIKKTTRSESKKRSK